MSYPAPDRRRRWSGMAAAAMIGATTLAATASVAAAGEAGLRELHLEQGTASINGEKLENRQVVLLGDPVGDLVPEPPVPPEVEALTRRMTQNARELAGPVSAGTVFSFSANGDWQEIARLGAELGQISAELAADSAQMDFASMSEEEIGAWADQVEVRAELFGARIEAHAARLEAHIEAQAAQLEARMDAAAEGRADAIEQRIAADADKIELAMRRHYGPDFEARISARSALIGDLVADCRDADLNDGDTRIMEREDEAGARLRLVCIAGGPEQLRGANALAVIEANRNLTDAEKEVFREQRAGADRRIITMRSERTSPFRPVRPVTAPPAAPAAPDVPLAGEPPEAPRPPERYE